MARGGPLPQVDGLMWTRVDRRGCLYFLRAVAGSSPAAPTLRGRLSVESADRVAWRISWGPSPQTPTVLAPSEPALGALVGDQRAEPPTVLVHVVRTMPELRSRVLERGTRRGWGRGRVPGSGTRHHRWGNRDLNSGVVTRPTIFLTATGARVYAVWAWSRAE